MNLIVRVLGAEILHVTTDATPADQQACDYTSQPVGFTASPGEQRWEKGTETL